VRFVLGASTDATLAPALAALRVILRSDAPTNQRWYEHNAEHDSSITIEVAEHSIFGGIAHLKSGGTPLAQICLPIT
jgi:hypothetical protein